MKKSEVIHYDISKIRKKDCLYNLIFGEKSNGKSYQVKHMVVDNYLKHGTRFCYVRRMAEDVKRSMVERYFADIDISKITDGRVNTFTTFRDEIYFAFYDKETCKTKRLDKIGYIIPVSKIEHYESNSFLDVGDIFFEEFMNKNGYYFSKEVKSLEIFYNTVDRKRLQTKLWMIGNTVTKSCPYFHEWGVFDEILKMKQGDIKVLPLNDVKSLAIEYCKSLNKKSGAIGQISGMIDNGEWQAEEQPVIPKPHSTPLFRCGFFYGGLRFIGELYYSNSGYPLWYIYPYTKGEFKYNFICFTDIIDTNPNHSISPATCRNKRIFDLFNKTFKKDNIFYCDYETGTDFKVVTRSYL